MNGASTSPAAPADWLWWRYITAVYRLYKGKSGGSAVILACDAAICIMRRPPEAVLSIDDYLHSRERRALERELRGMMEAFEAEGPEAGPPRPCADVVFTDLALRIFRYQFERCPPYRRLCEVRGIGMPEDVSDLTSIPFCPVEAFKLFRIACFDPWEGEARFHTSGTTSGRPGLHVMPNAELYDAAALAQFRRALLRNGASNPSRRSPAASTGEGSAGDSAAGHRFAGWDFLALTADPAASPHSSLVHMIDAAGRAFGAGSRVRYFYREGAPDLEALRAAIDETRVSGRRVLLLSTAFALVQCLDAIAGTQHCAASHGPASRLTLPAGSRIMETGGYKGRTRELSRSRLYSGAAALFGVPESSIVNEYGMTEMSSQFYDWPADRAKDFDPPENGAIAVAATAGQPRHDLPAAASESADPTRRKFSPPWVRNLVLDPATLRPLGVGQVGALAHIDLANLDSCAFLLTGDAGRLLPGGGFELIGRFEDAELRGCSLDYEMASAEVPAR